MAAETAVAIAAIRVEEPELVTTRGVGLTELSGDRRVGAGHDELVVHPILLVATAEDEFVSSDGDTERAVLVGCRDGTGATRGEVAGVVDDPTTFRTSLAKLVTASHETITTAVVHTESETSDRQAASFNDGVRDARDVATTAADDSTVVLVKDLPADLVAIHIRPQVKHDVL